jgi:hypothetical protein
VYICGHTTHRRSSLTDDLVSLACHRSGMDGRYEESTVLAAFMSPKILKALGIQPKDISPLHPLHQFKLDFTIKRTGTWVPRDPPPLVRRSRLKRVRDGPCYLALRGRAEGSVDSPW